MVKMLRVDDRLLHGQVAVTWVGQVGATNILIANDDIVKNEMGMMALKMAKPSSVRLAIKSVDDAIALLNDSRSESLSIFVIVKYIEDALRVIKATKGIEHVNIGVVKQKGGGKLIGPACYITSEDVEVLKEIDKLVGTLEFRTVSTASPKDLKQIMSIVKGE